MIEKVVHKYKLGEEPKDYEYWLTKTPEERFLAVEELRYQWYGDEINKRLQRVFTIIKLA